MTDNLQNSELLVESQEANPKIQEKEETIPTNQDAGQKDEVVHEKTAPRSRGRPAGSKDNKPRIKRVPLQQPPPQQQQQQQQQQETAAKEATPTPPKKPRKKVEIRYEEEEPPEPVSEIELPPPKSPRTLHKERVQAAAMQRRQIAQARQDHFERILDDFMGF